MRPPRSFDRVAESYDATRRLPDALVDAATEALTTAFLRRRVLEVGVGTGRWARPLQARGVALTGIDVSARMLAVGRAQGLDDVARADVRRLPFRDGAFGAALASHVLHLVPEWPRALAEVARVTRGRLWSVLEHGTERPDLTGEYLARVARHGGRRGPVGLPERELGGRLAPDDVRAVGEASWTVPARERLAQLEARCFSHTWEPPEALHRAVVEELRAQHGEGEVTVARSLELAAWDTRALAALAARALAEGVGAPERPPRPGSA